jgi:hypothetical protein
MITAPVVVLGLAALGGATMAIMRLRGMLQPPTWLAIVHGVVAATGVVLLIYNVAATEVAEQVKLALGILLLAALGGAGLFIGFHMRGRRLPIPFVLAHGLVATAGYVLLLMSVWGR